MLCEVFLLTQYCLPQISKDSPLLLCNLALVSPSTAQKLQILTHGFRQITDKNQCKILAHFLVSQTISNLQDHDTIYVPYSLQRQLSNKTIVSRKEFQQKNITTVEFPVAKQVTLYINSTFNMDSSLIQILTQSDFVFNNGQYFIDLKWINKRLEQMKSLRQKQKYIFYSKQQEYLDTYLRIYLQADVNQKSSVLFKKGESKLNIVKNRFHPKTIYQRVKLNKYQNFVFEKSQFLELGRTLEKLSESCIVLLQSQKEVGLDRFLHHSCQDTDFDFSIIQCKQLASSQQFYSLLKQNAQTKRALILIRDVEWINELYQAQQITGINIRQIIKHIQAIFEQVNAVACQPIIFIIEFQGKIITKDMLKRPIQISFNLENQTKSQIIQFLLQQKGPKQFAQYLTSVFSSKVAWKSLEQLLDNNKNASSWSKQQAIKQLNKLRKHEQAQNIIEVSWDDVGGLQNAKQQIIQTILLPIRHPQIFDEWIKPRTGLLFYGPPGTGKTLLGKCIAKECKMSFISVKGPELLNMYVGESQKNVRQVFQRAFLCRPCIVFMDELDALVPKRGGSSDSNQVMDRIVAQLLLQMDTAPARQIFIIGATNRPDLLDPSILRPGRFDKQIYLGITTSREDRAKILKAQTRHLTLEPDLSWQRLLDRLPQNFTGADFYGLTSKAVMTAAERTIREYDSGLQRDKILINEEDFLKAVEEVKPSVSQADLRRYEYLKTVYS